MQSLIDIEFSHDEARTFFAEKRRRGERRKKDYTKAIRKQRIDRTVISTDVPLYDNLHQYSKNKIHCSCPRCAFNPRHNGRVIQKSVPHSEMLRIASLDDRLKEYETTESVYPECEAV